MRLVLNHFERGGGRMHESGQGRDEMGTAGEAGAIALRELPVGAAGRIAAPRPGESIPSRLQDLGFVPGTLLRVVRRAPFGDPVELEIRGYRLCLRAEQIAGLRVEPERAGDFG